MIVDSATIGLIGAGSLAAGLGTTFAVQKKFGISVRNVNQKSLKQRSEEMQERFKFGQPFQGSALFGAMSVSRRNASANPSCAPASRSPRSCSGPRRSSASPWESSSESSSARS